MIVPVDFQKTIEQAFLDYGASVAQERSIPDVRDGLKIGLRQGLYAQCTNRLTHRDKFQKAQKSVAAAMAQSYVHGDVAMYDTLIRAAKPWAYRYPIEDVQGAFGDPREPDNHSASRYVEMRAGELADYFFHGLKKNVISEWYNNYDDTEKIPSVFPSMGFWNVVNGCSGIAVAMATSVPQFNLREVNNALISIIRNPNVSFDDIYCVPDFATGGTIINPREVKESLRTGEGKAIKLRAKLSYDPNQHMIQATELPYGVFTTTVIKQLEEITNEDEGYGIERIVDHTKEYADIRIYLSKGVNAKRMIEKLYKDTSLESFFGVNMIMLDMGRFPKVFGWREACDAYINHISTCKRNEYIFDRDKLIARNHVIEGLLVAIANIDEVVSIIRGSSNVAEATVSLRNRFNFSDPQIKAILDLKLQRLVKLDGFKLEEEHKDNAAQIDSINTILDNKELFNEELIKILQSVSNKFGDARRTGVSDVSEQSSSGTSMVPEENITAFVLSNNCIRLVKNDDMNGSKRGKKGTSLKMPKNVVVSDTLYTTTQSKIAVITDKGKIYFVELGKLDAGNDYSIYQLANLDGGETIVKIVDANQFEYQKYILFVTRNGLIKKSATSEYNVNGRGVIALKLKENDSVVNCFLSNNETDRVFIASTSGNYNLYSHAEINAVGRNASGVKAIKLNDNEFIAGADIVRSGLDYVGILSVNNNGRGKLTAMSEFNTTTRAIKGSAVQKLNDGESLAYVCAILSSATKVNVLTNTKMTTMQISEIPCQGRATQGVQLIDARGTDTKLYVIAE